MKAVNEKDIEITKELFEFIEKSPTAFHAVEQMKNRLDKEGYQQLLEGKKWELQSKEKYYVIRNGSAIRLWQAIAIHQHFVLKKIRR